MTIKTVAVCKTCGSANVTNDSVSRFCVETQQWEQSALLDNADCDDCGGETHIDEIAIEDAAAVFCSENDNYRVVYPNGFVGNAFKTEDEADAAVTKWLAQTPEERKATEEEIEIEIERASMAAFDAV